MTYWMVVDRTIRFWDTALSSQHHGTQIHTVPVTPTIQGTPGERSKKKNFWQKQKNLGKDVSDQGNIQEPLHQT